MGIASHLLERLCEDLEVLPLHTRAYLDEFGTLLCYLEGGRGGGTTLLHAPYTEALPVLQALNGLAFRGRVLLALDPSPLSPPLGGPPHTGATPAPLEALPPTLEGLPLTGPTRAPLEHLLRRHRPDRLLLAFYGQGLGRGFPGGKETEAGWRPLEAEGAPLHLRVRSPTGLLYPERRAYPAWESPPLPVDLPETEGPYLGGVGRALGVPTYGVGLVDLKASLEALFRLF